MAESTVNANLLDMDQVKIDPAWALAFRPTLRRDGKCFRSLSKMAWS